MASHIIDAHSHLQLRCNNPDEHDSIFLNEKIALMSVEESCWSKIKSLTATYPTLIAAYGVHPWYSHRVKDGWLPHLRQALVDNPESITGEIGLDRSWVPRDSGVLAWGEQLMVFNAQVELATTLRRPVSVHCVHCQGFMHDYLRSCPDIPPSFYFHSYGGSAEMIRGLSKMKRFGNRFYFGFSHAVNHRSPKTASVIAACPPDRILLESDLEDNNGRKDDLLSMALLISDARGWSLDATISRLNENAARFYTGHL
jgi:TatD DNase family protein